jgi:hypothetical protein
VTTSRRRRWLGLSKATRDAVLFVGGLVGIANEAVFHHDTPSTWLLGVYVTMIGSVPLLRVEEWLRKRGS